MARALVFAGNLLHSIGASLLASSNDELAGELERTRAELVDVRAELEHQGAAVVAAGTAAAITVVDKLEQRGAVIVVDELEHQGADDASRPAAPRHVDDESWLGFGGFPPNQSSGSRL